MDNSIRGLIQQSKLSHQLNLLDSLEKGKRAVVGEIREWDGIKNVKMPNGEWKVYQDTSRTQGGKREVDDILALHWHVTPQQAAQKILHIMRVTNNDAPSSEKLTQLQQAGVASPRALSLLSGATFEETIEATLPISDEDNKSIEESIRMLLEADGLDFDDSDLDKINPLTGKDSVDTVQDKFTDMIAKKERKLAMFYGTGGVGKAATLTTPILTPYGFKLMGDIEVGDSVITPYGTESKVLRIYPQGIRPVYEVTFKDGRKSRCDEEHLWKVKERNTYTWEVLPLSEIKKRGLKKKDGVEYMFGIPLLEKPFQHKRRSKVKVDPWLIGFLLGDGCWSGTEGITFSVGDRDKEFILEKIQQRLGTESSIVYRSQCDYSITSTSLKSSKNGRFRTLLSKAISDYKLYGTKSDTKFIPEEYFRCSSEEKLELIQGLMDSDGFVDKEGICSFTSVSEKLAKQFHHLVCSMGGGFAKVASNDYNVKNGSNKLFWEVTFMLPGHIIPVSLPFKVERIQETKKPPIDSLSIIDIQYIGEEETKCILIDHPEHLYITDDFLVTHNTYGVKQVLLNPETLNGDTGEVFDNKLVEYDSELNPTSEQYDLIKFTGKVTPSKLFRVLYEHNGKVILFDDADSVLLDEDSVNILKAATDTTLEDVVWDGGPIKSSQGDDRLPTRFKFTGGVIIISNLSERKLKQVASPLLESRALALDVSRTMDETIDKLDRIKNKLPFEDRNGEPFEVAIEHREAAINFIKKYKDHMPVTQVNGRTLGALALLHVRGGVKFANNENEFYRDFAARSLMNVKQSQIIEFHKKRLLEERATQRRQEDIRGALNQRTK